MADFDYTDDMFSEEEPAKKGFSIDMLDIFSILLLIGAACLGAYFLLVFINPFTALNPVPPNTPIPPVLVPTATITPQQLAELWTPTPTIQPTITQTPRPTFTPFPTNTPLVLFEPTATEEPPTPSPTPGMPFEAESIKHMDAKIFHPETNCDWMGVGGVILDKNGAHYWGAQVRIQGTLAGKTIDQLAISGMGNSFGYGVSGFDFQLEQVPIASTDTLFILISDQSGLPLSDQVYFSTLAECDKNLTFITIRQVR